MSKQRIPRVHVAACGPIDARTANAIGTMAGLAMRDLRVRVALRAVVEAHELYVAHLVGVQVGVIKPGPKERTERLRFWMHLCDAVRAGDTVLNPSPASGSKTKQHERRVKPGVR